VRTSREYRKTAQNARRNLSRDRIKQDIGRVDLGAETRLYCRERMAKSMQGWARRKVMCKRKTKKKTDE
jgi:hypothetical protein